MNAQGNTTDREGAGKVQGRGAWAWHAWHKVGASIAVLVLVGAACQDEKPTHPLPPPSAVEDLLVAASDSVSLLLTWTASGAHGTNGTAARYDLRFALSDSSRWEEMERWPIARPPKSVGLRESVCVEPLRPESDYCFQLQVIAPDSSRSLPSNRAFGATSTPDRIPPGRPEVRFLRSTQNSVTVHWLATGDDGDAGRAAAYRIRYRPVESQGWWLVQSVPSPRPSGSVEQFTLTGLTSETGYDVEIAVFDEAGNGAIGRAWSICWTGVVDDEHWADDFGPPPSGSGIEGQVLALASYGSLLVAGGDFTRAGTLEVNDLAGWDGRTWRRLGLAGTTGDYAKVTRLLTVGNDLYAAGAFTAIGGVTARNIARWDGASWHAMAGGSEGMVGDLTILEGSLVARGWFRFGDRLVANARWNGDAWEEVAGPAAGSLIEAVGGTLYATGELIDLGDSLAWVSRLEDGIWSPILVTGEFGGLPFTIYGVNDLFSWRGVLCAGGAFCCGVGKRVIAWDGGAWRDLEPPINYHIADMEWPMVYVLAEYEGQLVAGGSFLLSSTHHSCSLLRSSGAGWQGFGSGIGFRYSMWLNASRGTVRAACAHDGSLFVGGNFEFAGLKPSANIARWDP